MLRWRPSASPEDPLATPNSSATAESAAWIEGTRAPPPMISMASTALAGLEPSARRASSLRSGEAARAMASSAAASISLRVTLAERSAPLGANELTETVASRLALSTSLAFRAAALSLAADFGDPSRVYTSPISRLATLSVFVCFISVSVLLFRFDLPNHEAPLVALWSAAVPPVSAPHVAALSATAVSTARPPAAPSSSHSNCNISTFVRWVRWLNLTSAAKDVRAPTLTMATVFGAGTFWPRGPGGYRCDSCSAAAAASETSDGFLSPAMCAAASMACRCCCVHQGGTAIVHDSGLSPPLPPLPAPVAASSRSIATNSSASKGSAPECSTRRLAGGVTRAVPRDAGSDGTSVWLNAPTTREPCALRAAARGTPSSARGSEMTQEGHMVERATASLPKSRCAPCSANPTSVGLLR
mmetsp:Transcript_33553/g.84503  ORF Transcript_33553/g.84503 Transcript_33553/m.84503 type:complete len:416 (+) Transcript_33553:934-2181(+)